MKKVLFYFIFIFLFIPSIVNAKEVNIYLFYGEGCSHCEALLSYLNKSHSDINVYKYEVWNNEENKLLFEKVQKELNEEAKGVPYYIIGEKVLQGYNESEGWEKTVDRAIESAKNSSYDDKVSEVLNIDIEKEETISDAVIEEKETSTIYKNTNKKNNTVLYTILTVAIIDILVTGCLIIKPSKKL